MADVIRGLVNVIGVTRPEYLPKHPIWFTESTFGKEYMLPDEKPDIKDLLSIAIEAKITSSLLVKTPESVSFEGQMLEGNKLILAMHLKQNIKYVADVPAQSVHLAYFENTIKGIGIVLPTHHLQPSTDKYYKFSQLLDERKVNITPYIEDIHGTIRSKRSLYVNISTLIDVTLKKL